MQFYKAVTQNDIFCIVLIIDFLNKKPPRYILYLHMN